MELRLEVDQSNQQVNAATAVLGESALQMQAFAAPRSGGLWDEIRERTLKSTAPALIYRDSDLIKRAIRDLYHRDIDEVIVEGEDGYKAARGFMKLLMPSHVRRVNQHTESTPLFQRYGVEDQLSAMYQPVVQLKSGGYLVINPTEALVSIDINSGRSTREHNVEQTAFSTNLEAEAEIARQMGAAHMAYSTPLMRLQDPAQTKIIIVTLAETTPVLEAAGLQDDLERAGIHPWAWVVNNSIAAARPESSFLRTRARSEVAHIAHVRELADRIAIVPLLSEEPTGVARLSALTGVTRQIA